jgi:hypothetical protein
VERLLPPQMLVPEYNTRLVEGWRQNMILCRIAHFLNNIILFCLIIMNKVFNFAENKRILWIRL